MRDDRERLSDILEAIIRIEKYSIGGKRVFESNELIQNWILRYLQIIGEAGNQISAQFRILHPELPWRAIVGMRNILVHQYFDIDLEIVWSVVERDLPDFKRKIESILKTWKDSS